MKRSNSYQATYLCNANYRYMISNNKLLHPIATITADEITYAGTANYMSNINYYLNKNTSFWTMSPNHWNTSGIVSAKIVSRNIVDNSHVTVYSGVRPVINLVQTTTVTGEGTSTSPWLVQ